MSTEDNKTEEESYTKIYKKAVSILVAALTKEELLELHGEWDQDSAHDLFWMFSEEVAKIAPEEFGEFGQCENCTDVFCSGCGDEYPFPPPVIKKCDDCPNASCLCVNGKLAK